MACGKPVIAFGRGGVTDVVENGIHGMFYPEQTSESLQGALAAFQDDVYDPSVIRAQAEKFSKTIFQEKITKLLATL
jgi:glycosyltransferase involved in cell wall biosynthesis